MSIRKHLLISILLIISIVGGITIWGSYKDSVNEVQELFDAQLARSARMILGLTLTEVQQGHVRELQRMIFLNKLDIKEEKSYFDKEKPEDEKRTNYGHSYENKLAFQVWDIQENMILRSGNAPLEPFANNESGFSDTVINSTHWRVFSLWNHRYDYLVMTAERNDVRMDLVNKITLKLLLPFLLLLPVLAFLLWLAVGKGLRPLKIIADEVKNRDGVFLKELDTSHVPNEVKPLVYALNIFFLKIKKLIEKERRFTSDAAHELRTPLAAVKTHAQIAQSATEPKTLEHSLLQIDAGMNRANHIVDQLLALARSESGDTHKQTLSPVDIYRLGTEVTKDLAPLAIDKNIDLSVQDSESLIINGASSGLSMLIRNLVDNAIRYTPESGKVTIHFLKTDNSIELHVIDTGPGISDPAEQEKVFERFYRGESLSQNGCGIGLSIVKQVADFHKATINLSDAEGGGLHVMVIFPTTSPNIC
jgi:signal transduction histidine kinase